MSNEAEEWKKRALNAERERDEANSQFDNIKECYDDEVRYRERAEADNAALLDAVNTYRTTRGEEYCQCQGRGTCRACALEKVLTAPHPAPRCSRRWRR